MTMHGQNHIKICKWTYLETCIFLVCHVGVWQSLMRGHEHIIDSSSISIGCYQVYHVSAVCFVQDTVKCYILVFCWNRNLIQQKNPCIQREICMLATEHSKITPLTGIQRNIHPGCEHSNKTNKTQTALFTTAECFIQFYTVCPTCYQTQHFFNP